MDPVLTDLGRSGMARLARLCAYAVPMILTLIFSGCAPTLIWTSKSPDRRHSVTVQQSGSHQEVWVDGEKIGSHRGLALSTFAWSPNGTEWAYAARDDRQWHMVRNLGTVREVRKVQNGLAKITNGRNGGNDQRLGDWDGIGDARFSPVGKHLAYTAERQGQWHVVVDQDVGPEFDAILSGSLRFDSEGKHFAYAAQRGDKTTVVLDQSPGPFYDGIASLTFDPKGHLAYAMRRDNQAFAVYDGKVGPAFDAITEMIFSPSNDILGYVGRRRENWHAVIEGIESKPYARIRDLTFSTDELSTAFVAREVGEDGKGGIGGDDRAGGEEFVVQDGVPERRGFVSIRPGSLTFSRGNDQATYIAVRPDKKLVLVFDGEASVAWDEISGPRRSADLAHIGFAARAGAVWSVLADGKKIAEESWAGPPVFGAGGAMAYPARRNGKESVIVSGKTYAFDLVLEDSILFGPDGRHWGCIAGSRLSKGFFFVVDGVKRRELDVREIVGLNQGGDSANQEKIIQAWVSAEITLATSPSQ